MDRARSLRSRGVVSMTVVLGVGLAAVFFGPLHVPVGTEGISDAYMVGFNTRACLLLVALLVGGFAVWSGGAGFEFSNDRVGPGLSRRLLILTTLVTMGLAGSVWVIVRLAGPVNEAAYFADRYWMLRSGSRVYRDFEFSYGPLLFYLPLWIARATRMSLTDSYFLAWVVQWAAGVAVLWKMVSLAAGGGAWARTIYLLIWGFYLGALPDVGMNYTPLRFSSTLLLALLVHRLYWRRASVLAAFALASGGMLVLLFYSPEQGLVFFLGSVVFWLANHSVWRQGTVTGLAMLCGIALVGVLLADGMGVLGSMRSFAGGGWAFPLTFSLQNTLLLLLLVTAGCGVWTAIRRNETQHPLVYLCAISVFSAPAAFSRCDVGHLLLNLMGSLLAGLILLRPRAGLRLTAKYAFFVLIVLLGGLIHLYNDRGLILLAMRQAIGQGALAGGKGPAGLLRRVYVFGMVKGKRGATAQSVEQSLAARELDHAALPLRTSQILWAPMGFAHRSFDEPLTAGVSEPRTGRYVSLLPLMNLGEPAQKIAELEARPDAELLLPGDRLSCEVDDVIERRMLRAVLMPIYLPPIVHPVTEAEPLCRFIEEHYVAVRTDEAPPAYTLWRRKR